MKNILLILAFAMLCLTNCTKDDNNNNDNPAGTVTDIDGNVYHTVKIGSQVWMVENLRVTNYRNGDPIANIIEKPHWDSLTTGAYCWYNNDIANKGTYGALYNWYAVNDSRKIAPQGWHIPADAEWTILIDYLGGIYSAGGSMKEAGTTHWASPNHLATNSSGFTALPGGYRGYGFGDLKETAYFCQSFQNSDLNRWILTLGYYSAWVNQVGYNIHYGYSVRCLRD